MPANFVSFCSWVNFLSPSGLLSGKRNQISSPRTSLFIRLTREKVRWNSSLVCCASSPHSGVGPEPREDSLSRKTDSERDSPAPSWRNASKGAIAHARENILIFCLLVSMSSFPGTARMIPHYNTAIVGRRRDVFSVTSAFYMLEVCRDALRGGVMRDYRLTLPFAPHLYGCGKTALVKEYQNLLDAMGGDWVASQKTISDLTPGFFLNNMKQGCLLYVDMSRLTGIEPKERDLKWAVWYVIIEAACKKMALPVPDPEEVHEELQMLSTAFIEKIRAILGLTSDQYLVVGFDEVGVLDSVHKFFDVDNFRGRIGPYDNFFGIVRRLCELPHFFPIIVGKCEGLNVRNYLGNASKILLKLVPLSPLDQASIEEHLEKSTFKNTPVSSVLCHRDFSIKDLSELLLEYTDGVPGLIVGAVSVLLKYVAATPNVSFTRESIESILNDPTNAEKCVAPYYLSRLEGLSDEHKVTMKKLILSHLYCIQFGLRNSLSDSGQDSAYVFDLLTDFGLYRREYSKPGEREMCQVSIPKLLACFLETQLETDTLSALLFRTIRAQSVHFLHESRCRVLEGFVATKFYLSLALRHYENSLFPLFRICLEHGVE